MRTYPTAPSLSPPSSPPPSYDATYPQSQSFRSTSSPIIKEAVNVDFQQPHIQKPSVSDSLKNAVTMVQTRISPNSLEISQHTSSSIDSISVEQCSSVTINMPMAGYSALIKYSNADPHSPIIDIHRAPN